MIIEGSRMIEVALKDGTLGVNAQIDALLLDTAVGAGSPDARPSHVAEIRNAVDSDPTVKETETTFPLVIINVMQPAVAPGQIWSGIRDSEIDFIIAYIRESGDVSKNLRDTDYTLRASDRAIAHGLLASGKRDTVGTRNGFAISKSSKLRYGPTHQPDYGGVMTGAVQFTMTMRDLAP
jgi:hypothetical protein